MRTLGPLAAGILTAAAVTLAACGGGANEAATHPTGQATATARATYTPPEAASTAQTDAAPTETPQAAATPTPQPTRPPAPAATQPSPPPPPTNTPVPPPTQPQSLTIAANGLKFVPSKLTASNGSPINVTFDNQDAGVAHDLIVYTPAGGIAGQADIFTGPATRTFTFTPAGTGTYAFKCSVHPTSMYGTIAVTPS